MSGILLTGSTGFLGSSLLKRLVLEGNHNLTASVRKAVDDFPKSVQQYVVPDLNSAFSWQQAVQGMGVVIHCAARVHVINDPSSNPLYEFRKVNVEATLRLARQAATSGVRRFIFISSIKVNGELTQAGYPYFVDSAPMPVDAYGFSKMEAEQGLRALAAETGMEVVIIRPVLIYGPGVKANFRSMMHWLTKGVPLPLGALDNMRSLVALENLVDLIVTCIDHPAAANQTFLVSDDEDVSTSELLRRMGRALGKPVHLLPVPAWLLTVAATTLGKRDVAQRLCGSLQVDISKTKALLNWVPVISLDAALQQTANDFLEQQDS